MSRLNTGVPPRPRGALAGQPRAPWCVSRRAQYADALRVAVVPPAATVSHSPVCQCACWTGGIPMPLTDAGLGQPPRGFLFLAPFRVASVCVCVCTTAVVVPFLPGLPGWTCMAALASSGRSLPIIAGLWCRPGVHPCIAPRSVRYALRPDPGSLPQDHPRSGVVAPWLSPGQLHGNISTSPSSPCRPMCCVCIGVFTAGGARGSEAASTAYSIWLFPHKGCP